MRIPAADQAIDSIAWCVCKLCPALVPATQHEAKQALHQWQGASRLWTCVVSKQDVRWLVRSNRGETPEDVALPVLASQVMAIDTIPSVLLIDDETQVLEILGQLFTALGVSRVVRAASAEEALGILEKQEFAIIISDYRLEGMDGVAFVEQLRATGNRTPVLMLSGAPDKMAVIRAARQPAVDFFPKPFELQKLMGAVERLAEAA